MTFLTVADPAAPDLGILEALKGVSTLRDYATSITGTGGFETVFWSSGAGDAVAGVRRFSANGTVEETVYFDTTGISGDPTRGQDPLVRLDDGGYLLVWDERVSDDPFRDTQNVFALRFDAAGNRIGDSLTLLEARPRVDEDFGEPVAIVLESGLIAVSALRTGAQPATIINVYATDLSLLHTTEIAITGSVGRVEQILTALPSGDFLMTNLGFEQQLQSQLFDQNSVALNPPVVVQSLGGSFLDDVSVTPLENGRTLVLWRSNESINSIEVYGQILDTDGSALGANFQVNTRTYDIQELPQALALPGGGFYVTWIDYGGAAVQIGAPFDPEPAITGRLYSASGTAVTEEEIVIP